MYLKDVECYVGEGGDNVNVKGNFWLRHFELMLRCRNDVVDSIRKEYVAGMQVMFGHGASLVSQLIADEPRHRQVGKTWSITYPGRSTTRS